MWTQAFWGQLALVYNKYCPMNSSSVSFLNVQYFLYEIKKMK